MNDEEQVYRNLQQHLDKQTLGYPATRSGVEIRILKRLFTPEEAQLALNLTYKPVAVGQIYESARPAGISLDVFQDMLYAMARKGAIGQSEKDGKTCFSTMPFVVGMFEYQLGKLTPEFLADTDAYFSDRAFGLSLLSTKVPQMRTVPVGRSISAEHHVMTCDDIIDVIRGSVGPFAIQECICRKSAAMKGNLCEKTSRTETCMPIGEMAKRAVESGQARGITKDEALDIVRTNEDEGLVFQPSNTQKVDFVCACCGCCCGMLHVQKMLPRPIDFWATNFQVSVNLQSCSGCGTCVDRCQVDAVRIDGRTGTSFVDLNRCIGCGNCVVTCPSGAMNLHRRERETIPPRDHEDLHDLIMTNKKGPLGRARLVAKLILKK